MDVHVHVDEEGFILLEHLMELGDVGTDHERFLGGADDQPLEIGRRLDGLDRLSQLLEYVAGQLVDRFAFKIEGQQGDGVLIGLDG